MKINYFDQPITKRFIDAFPKFYWEDGDNPENKSIYFYHQWLESPFYTSGEECFDKENMKKVYNHLLAHFYNWHFKYLEDLGILLNIFKRIEEYWPNAYERVNLASQLRKMSLSQYADSGKIISSQGQNPKTRKTMSDLIDHVDSQTANFRLKSEEQTIKDKFVSLFDGIMDDFMEKFRDLFVQIYSGVNDYLYRNYKEE